MFGYVVANNNALTPEARSTYRAYYCGLCHALGRLHGTSARITLSYDLTFLALFLSSLYNEKEDTDARRCPIHPMHRHQAVCTFFSEYAADMNLLLTYHKFLDDRADDGNLAAGAMARFYRRRCRRLEAKYPRQNGAIRQCLETLAAAERRNETNPDIPAAIFGSLMGEIFVCRDDAFADRLRYFGESLGKFLYLMDAAMDFNKDLTKKRYNPLILSTSGDFSDILLILMADVADAYRALPMQRNTDLIENILYSGVWTKFEEARRAKSKEPSHDTGGSTQQ